jgi:hypothetical protein
MKVSNMKNGDSHGGEELNVIDFRDVSILYHEPNNINNDSVNLIDLWLVLASRWRIFLSAAGVVVLLALLFVITKTDRYKYSISIEIGEIGSDLNPFIEQPESVLSKLSNSYIPEIISDYRSSHFGGYKITARLDKGTHIVILEAVAKAGDYPVYKELMNSVVGKIVRDHNRTTELHKKEIELAKSRTGNELVKLRDEQILYASQEKRLDERVILLKQRIIDAKKSLKNAEQTRQEAAKSVSTEGRALALLMMDGDIRSRNERLADFEEQSTIGIDNERDILANNILDNKRKQIELQEQLDRFDIQYANLPETRPLSEPLKSLSPVGVDRNTIVILAVLVGLFVGMFAVLLVEFFSKVRAYSNKQVI